MDKSKSIIAVDIGTESIKVFLGHHEADGSLTIKNTAFVSSKGYAKGEITDSNLLALTIKQAIDCVHFPGDNKTDALIYLGMGSVFMMGRSGLGRIGLTCAGKITRNDIERAFRAAVFAAVPEGDFSVLHIFSDDNVIVGGDSEDEEEVKTEYKLVENLNLPEKERWIKVNAHIVALPKAVIEDLTEALRAQGVIISGIVANSIVPVQNAMTELTKEKANCIYLDIGAGTIDLAVLTEGRISYSAVLPLGGIYITNDIMKSLDVSFFHAEAIKRYYAKLDKDLFGRRVILDCNDFGTTDKNIPYDFLHDIVECRVDEIISLLDDFLKPKLDKYVYRENKTLDKLLLAGGTAFLPSFVEKLSRTFGMEVKIASFEKLPPEYNCQLNAACYGTFCYAAKESLKTNDVPSNEDDTNRTNNQNISNPWGFFKKILKKY